MPPQSRVGDLAVNPADSHGCPVCPHGVSGPGVGGSPNVLINDQSALRIGDPGVHAACCGPNVWAVSTGSGTVFFNGIAASRLGDVTAHCGGVGTLVQGSDNVVTG